jgi:AcrR family transcriptional regulator
MSANPKRKQPPRAPGASPMGLRERKKAEKLEAIRRAARTLFNQKGYEGTTLREVAGLADVGFGTLAAYASDKAGLLAMVFIEDAQDLKATIAPITAGRALMEQLLEALATSFRFWARNRELSRVVFPLSCSARGAGNRYVREIAERPRTLREVIPTWLRDAKRLGLIVADCDEHQFGEVIFAVFTAVLQDWLFGGDRSLEEGLERLRYLLDVPLRAISPTPKLLAPSIDGLPADPMRSHL